MSEQETPQAEDAAAASPPPEAAAPPKPKPKPAAPARDLPNADDIARWAAGEDLPSLAELFKMPTGAPLPMAKFDALGMQIKKEELLPQHWPVIHDHSVPDDSLFDGLGEVGRLRVAYRDQELSRRRVENLRLAWRELAGKQPALWSVSDLWAGLRRLFDKKVEFDVHELLSAQRDVWGGMTLPFGQEQAEILWACLAFIRAKTRK